MLTEFEACASLQSAARSVALGEYGAAREACRTVLKSFPDRAAALYLLGIVASQEGDRHAAQDLLRRAADAPDALALYLLSYAVLVRKATDPAAALALIRRAVAMENDLPLGWFLLADQLLDMRAYDESRTCFEHALVLDAGLWQARARLGILLGRTGRIAEASESFHELLSRHPGNAEVIGGYAVFLQDIGRCAEALAAAEEAITTSPATLDHRLRAADIEIQLGRYGAALRRLDEAEHLAADDRRLPVIRATALRLLDRYDEAVAICRKALEEGRATPDLLRTFAHALHAAGEHSEALAMLDRAQAGRPALALSDKALLLSQLGRLAEAHALFDEALAHEPDLADAWYNKAETKTYHVDDSDIGAMERLLDASGSFRDRLLLHFALGKAYMDGENAKAAFLHWDQGNRMKRSITDYDADAQARHLASLAARVDADATERPAGAHLAELPVFIVGMPRCGSSLLEQILASHPQVHGAGEQSRLRSCFEESDVTSPHGIAEPALRLLRRFSTDAARVIDKDLRNFQHLGLIHRIFPRARIIHCRRNPLDACFSAYTKLFLGDFPFTYDLGELGLYYRHYHALMARWRSELPQRIFIEVDYETVVSKPVETTRLLVDFIGLPWNEACLRFFETPRAVNTASSAQVRRPVHGSSVGRAARLRPYLKPLVQALGELASPA